MSARVRGNVCLCKKDINQHVAARIEEAEMPKAIKKLANRPKNNTSEIRSKDLSSQ
ncbi:hypothetical protein PIB30_075430, partial [Stylosanthes scabra]|nr:hypothetical protein [Stylosanthes scabra]